MRKRAMAGTKLIQKSEGKKLTFYDIADPTYHVRLAGCDVNYFEDNGLGLKAVYVVLGSDVREAAGIGSHSYFPTGGIQESGYVMFRVRVVSQRASVSLFVDCCVLFCAG